MQKEFPKTIAFYKLLGPSFIILALGLGSGEVILFPYLVSNWGLGIAWGALLGITFQFFVNMEIERYALVKGESVFVGIAKVFRYATYWFIFSTFIGFGLPGIIAASAKVFSHLIGIEDFKYIAIAMLVTVGLVLSAGKTVYSIMEKITKTIILVSIPFILILAIYLSTKTDWSALFHGLVGIGDNYFLLPMGISFVTFLGAFAYAGAGGNLKLTQSIYIKEKGYGMGKYSQKIAGLFKVKGVYQNIKLTGESFEKSNENMSNFRKWWRLINLEHLIVFWFLGALAMMLLMILAFTTTYGQAGNSEGINFVINEGINIGTRTIPFIGTCFLLAVTIMLFQTQLGVMDSTSRIMAENAALIKLKKDENAKINLSKIYYIFVWSQILFGTILFLANIYEPKFLIVMGAVINAFAMFVHIALTYISNIKNLDKEFHPTLTRKIILLIIFLFFGFFSTYILLNKIGIL